MIDGTCHCGAVTWRMDAAPSSATACNCTICRRYGVLWAYGYFKTDIHVSGETKTYRRPDGGAIDFHFCGSCGCVTHYVAAKPGDTGNYWSAVNLRMCDAKAIMAVPVRHFDGSDTWRDLPEDGRTVRDMWF